jgi:hypothetical protein
MSDLNSFVIIYGSYKHYNIKEAIKVIIYIKDINYFINKDNIVLVLKNTETSEKFLAYKEEVRWYKMTTSSYQLSNLDSKEYTTNGCQIIENKDFLKFKSEIT